MGSSDMACTVGRAWHRSGTAEASHRGTAAIRRACSWHTCGGSCAGGTAAHTGSGEEEEGAVEGVASFAVQDQAHGHALRGVHVQELPPAVPRTCLLEVAFLQDPAGRALLLAPAVCSAQPADGDYSSCRLGDVQTTTGAAHLCATSRISPRSLPGCNWELLMVGRQRIAWRVVNVGSSDGSP